MKTTNNFLKLTMPQFEIKKLKDKNKKYIYLNPDSFIVTVRPNFVNGEHFTNINILFDETPRGTFTICVAEDSDKIVEMIQKAKVKTL